MVHSTVSCILDGTFVPIQRHLVTLSGSPLGTQWYTDTSNNVPKNDRPLPRQQGVPHTHVTWLLVAPHQTPSGRRVVFLASPTVQLVPMASGRCVVFLAPHSPVLSVPLNCVPEAVPTSCPRDATSHFLVSTLYE